MQYVILRVAREEITVSYPDGTQAPGIGIKTFPLRDAHNNPVTLDAPTPESAFSRACVSRENLRHSLAVEPLEKFQNDLARFAAQRAADPGRFLPKHGAKRADAQSPDSLRGKNPH